MAAAIETNPYLGIGVYGIAEAAQILGVPAQKVRRWADGYTFRVADQRRASPGLFARDFPELAAQKILTFLDLIELKVIAAYRKLNIPMHYIREVSQWACREFGVTHPFAVRRFHTDGSKLFVEHAPVISAGVIPQRVFRQAMEKQYLLDKIVEPFFKTLEYEGDLTRRYWPLGRNRRVVMDPRRGFGKPIDEPTGIPTYVLFAMVRGGEPIERVAWWYEVDEEAVEQAVEFETSLLAA
jgi:uncharacterized protein (DUF433 family)